MPPPEARVGQTRGTQRSGTNAQRKTSWRVDHGAGRFGAMRRRPRGSQFPEGSPSKSSAPAPRRAYHAPRPNDKRDALEILDPDGGIAVDDEQIGHLSDSDR